MAVTRQTLRLAHQLRVTVGSEADAATRAAAKAWAKAWRELAKQWTLAAADIAALQAQLGRYPFAWELSRLDRLQIALIAVERSLVTLATQTGVSVTNAAGNAIRSTVEAEPHLIASQLPATQRATAVTTFNARILPMQVEAIVARTAQQITALTRPLSRAAYDAVQRELVRGVAVGANPRETGRRIVARVEGAFAGGLSRATVIACTETLDAYRSASRLAHMANRDALAGWQWTCALDRRSCPSCWSRHGSLHPVDEIGPNDHQRGRCARTPITRSWADLGFSMREPDSVFPDARAKFAGLPEKDQRAILGDRRFELWRSGRVGWDDFANKRSTPGWRDSFAPTTVRDLERRATISA